MSIMNSILPTATSATLGNQQQTQRVQAQQNTQQVVTNAITSGAAIVHLSASAPNRSTSKGTEREQVDPSFAKERAKEEMNKTKEESKRTGKAVDISA